MEKKYGMYTPGSSGWTSMKNEEFHEEDVWGVLKQSKDSDSDSDSDSTVVKSSHKKPCFITKRVPSASQMIPKSHKTPINIPQEPKPIHHSAPVNVPDWSKIYGKKPSGNDSRTWLDMDKDDRCVVKSSWKSDEDEDEDEDEEEEEEEEERNVVPPHEWIAEKLSRSQISSFSVCEGAGRTLKGRDLSRVRNAVLTKTGFLES